jgi:tetratricopeptide (TPR) repeat protein
MRVAIALLLLVYFPWLACADDRVALVIGNSAYQHADLLPNPRNDATDLAASLKKFKFLVLVGIDLDRAAFEKKLREFSAALQRAQVGVFFYAGHGLQVAGQNYLVPVDAQLSTADALEFEMVRLDVVHRIMEQATSTNILFLDACRNNPLSRNLARAMGTRGLDISQGLAAVESGIGTLISFSTQPGNVALDGTGRNSPFAGALIRHISKTSDDLTSQLIHVRKDVIQETRGKQVPWDQSALTGQFYFAGTEPDTQPQAQAQPPALPALREQLASEPFAAAMQAHSFAALEAFAKQFEGTLWAEMARAEASELRKQATAAAAPRAATPDDWTDCRQGPPDLRISACTQIIGKGGDAPTLAIAFHSRGYAQNTKRNYDAAIKDYTKAIEYNPRYTEALLDRGIAYGASENYDAAIADYTTIIDELHQGSAAALLNRGLAYRAKRNTDNAITDYTEAIRLDGRNIEAYLSRGNAYRAKGDNDRAITDYSKAIEIDPTSTAALTNRGSAYRAKGSIDNAIADYTKAIEIDPKHVGAYNSRGNAYSASRKHDLAIADYTKALEINSKYAPAYYNRGLALRAKGNIDGAIAEFTKAIESDGKYLLAYVGRGNALRTKSNIDGAIADYTRAIELDTKYTYAYRNRGMAYTMKGDNDRAIADQMKVVELEPKNSSALDTLGMTYLEKGDYDLALASSNKAIEINPKDADAYGARGLALFYKGNFSDAAAEFLHSEQLVDDPETVLFHYLALARSGTPTTTELEASLARLEGRDWHSPLIELFLGRKSPEAALAAASKPSERCIANYFVGQWQLLRGDKAQAIKFLKAAAALDTCVGVGIPGVRVELQRLGSSG